MTSVDSSTVGWVKSGNGESRISALTFMGHPGMYTSWNGQNMPITGRAITWELVTAERVYPKGEKVQEGANSEHVRRRDDRLWLGLKA